ncbi:hypothetical protein WDJ51_08955 [Rathayibacter sp. YIM 133350]|uniref:hypothetical protein n=1 Tax=Rathayibacter sp. YIM 133350 TaxID=3131992 RepID=UPI00307F7680
MRRGAARRPKVLPSRTSTLRTSTLTVASVLALVGSLCGLTAVSPTQAAWTERAYAKATVTAGTWTPTPTPALACAPISAAVKATCTATVTGWTTWGTGYRVDYSVSTTSTTAFEWKLTLNLAVTGTPAPTGGTLFPGWPVPAESWHPAWTPSTFSMSNVCALTPNSALPTLTVAGKEVWSKTVVAGTPVRDVGVQATMSEGSTPAALAC